MSHLRSLARGLSPWAPARRASSGRDWPVARPFGGRLLWLVAILAAAVAFHGLRPGAPPVVLRGDIFGTARIIDGDTIDIAGTRIRLFGIDAPESDQTCTDSSDRAWRCGQVATHMLVAHVAGQPLKCQASGLDRYRRVLAICVLPDGSDINAWMVREGWALAYDQYSDAYLTQEGEARNAKRGIWAGSFMPPWDWRHQHRHWWMG